MTTDSSKTVFISYRRNVSSFIARAIFMDLREHGYDAFMDVESIDSGAFDTIILNQIAARAHFVLILTPGTLERCEEPGDWLRREIEYAMDLGRNIVPLLINEFRFDDRTRQYLTGKLADLPRFNALNVPHDYFDAAMDKLRSRFLKQPVTGIIQPTPQQDRNAVQRKIEDARQSKPTEEQVMAEQYLISGNLCLQNNDFEGAINNYTKAIRLSPDYALAYFNRGFACASQGDHARAITDYTEAIRINPTDASSYNNRGWSRVETGDYEGALADANEALLLNPRSAAALDTRGWALEHKGFWETALACYEESLALEPHDEETRRHRDDLLKKIGRQ